MQQLRLKIRDIPDAGVSLDVAFDRALLTDALAGADADLDASTAGAKLQVSKFGENVFVRGRIAGDLVVPCSRCLAGAHVPLDLPVHVTYAPEDEARAESNDVAEEEEFGTHDRQFVDLNENLREALLLAVPMTPLCRAECKGLCPVCGADKNAGDCGCDPHVPDPRFAALKGLKL